MSNRFSKKYLLVTLIILIGVIFAILELTDTTHLLHKEKPTPVTGNANTKGVPNTSSTPPATQSNSNEVKNVSSGTAAKTLAAPNGTFVNIYNAKIDEQLGSTCNTNPGATCQIIFTNGNLVKLLPARATDGGGAVYWSWKPNDKEVGLTPGTWHIVVKATMGAQTQTTSNDPLTLEITQ